MTDFHSFARAHGLMIRDLMADGRVHRVPTADHPKKRNGAYSWDGEGFGWVQNWAEHESAIIYRPERLPTADPVQERLRRARAEAAEAMRRAERKAVAGEARAIVRECEYKTHPYLERKGFPKYFALVDKAGWLVVPMRPALTYTGMVSSVQRIAPDGTKRFLKDGATKGCVYALGPTGARQAWLCEGYATGLSIDAALRAMYRQDRVIVCFSAGNLTHCAQLFHGAIVVADNDESGAGEAAARATGLRWVMPDMVDKDANDVHQELGLGALMQMLQRGLDMT